MQLQQIQHEHPRTTQLHPKPRSPGKAAVPILEGMASDVTPGLGEARITIALIEDNRLVREGITALLNSRADLAVVCGESSDDLSALIRTDPQVVLLDIGLQKGDSLRIAAQVRQELPSAKVIVMDLLPAHEDIVEFVNAGVSGFIMKDATLDDLVDTVRAVASGVSVLPPRMINTLFSQIANDAIVRGRPEVMDSVRMTPREREVINLIAEGLSNKEIATRLHVATHTVKSHVRNVMEKLTLHTRLQIAAYAHARPEQ
jgi:two-component system NarL family response regulator